MYLFTQEQNGVLVQLIMFTFICPCVWFRSPSPCTRLVDKVYINNLKYVHVTFTTVHRLQMIKSRHFLNHNARKPGNTHSLPEWSLPCKIARHNIVGSRGTPLSMVTWHSVSGNEAPPAQASFGACNPCNCMRPPKVGSHFADKTYKLVSGDKQNTKGMLHLKKIQHSHVINLLKNVFPDV